MIIMFASFYKNALKCLALASFAATQALAMPSMDMSKVLKSGKDLPPATEGRCLAEGTTAPNFSLPTAKGKTFTLYDELKTNNVVVVFYRGGWCPYCNFQLRAYDRELKPADAKNYRMIAISPDKINASVNISPKKSFGFAVAADPKLKAIKAYNLAFEAPAEVVNRLKTKGVDLNAQSGETHNMLPVPAAVIIGKDRKIKWCYANANYKIRPAVAELQTRIKALP